MKPDDKFLDGLLQMLSEAPRTQIDEDIVADIKKFMSKSHTLQEKYDFIQNISKEPLNMISDQIGVGRITPFVQLACDLNKTFGEAKPEEIIVTIDDDLIPKKGYVKKYGWDGKPMIVKDESEKSKITVEYLAANQGEKKQERALVKIFGYMEDLMWAGKFDIIDKFIEDFCKEDICFQYCLCLLTAACWAKDKIKNKEMLIEKTKQQGIKEIGEKDTNSCLRGLI
jgi:hypothetical protein